MGIPNKKTYVVIGSILFLLIVATPTFADETNSIFAKIIQKVLVINDASNPIPVTVVNLPSSTPTSSPTATPSPTSTPAPDSKLVQVFLNRSLIPGELVLSDPIDIRGYKKMTIQAFRPEGPYNMIVSSKLSNDGIVFTNGTPQASFIMNSQTFSFYSTIDINGQYAKIQIENGGGTTATPSVSVNVYLTK